MGDRTSRASGVATRESGEGARRKSARRIPFPYRSSVQSHRFFARGGSENAGDELSACESERGSERRVRETWNDNRGEGGRAEKHSRAESRGRKTGRASVET